MSRRFVARTEHALAELLAQDLTGLDLASASLLDEATAAAEAMALARRVAKSSSNLFFVDENCHPQTISVVQTRAEAFGFELLVAPLDRLGEQPVFGALLQYPDTHGEIRDLRPLIEQLHAQQALACVAADLLSLLLLTPLGLRRLQPRHWVDDQQVAHRHEGDGGHDGQRHHEKLEQMQGRGPAGNLQFDGLHEPVHLPHERVGPRQDLCAVGALAADKAGARLVPLLAHSLELRPGFVAPWHEQRPRRVARAQQLQAGVELPGPLQHGVGRLGVQHQHHAQHVHAQAPRFVHGGGSALQLPGDPQGQADGRQCHHEKARAHGEECGDEESALRNAAIPAMRKMGRGVGYENPHDEPGHINDQEHLLEFVSRKLGSLKGVTGAETSLILKVAKFSYEWEIP